MTEDQIRAIAEEFAESELVMSYMPTDGNKFFAERFLNFLIQKYCIVEREKVMSWWNDVTNCYLNHNHATFDGMREMFADFFGTSMFNQDEE